MRSAPLFLLAFVLVMASVTVGSTFLWVIAVVAFLALLALLFFIHRSGEFHGPRVLMDDARRRLISGDDDDVDVIEVPVTRKHSDE